MGPSPELCAVLVAASDRVRAQRVVDSLCQQTARPRMEILVIDRQPGLQSLRGEGIDIIAASEVSSFAAARVMAARRTAAPIVAYIEDHCYATPGWAEALLLAHQNPWSAVGYAISNANPEAWLSRAVMIAEYSAWKEPRKTCTIKHLPSHNISYKREVLRKFDSKLEALMSPDQLFLEVLGNAGHTFGIAACAVAAHENRTRIDTALFANFHYGRLHAANRSAELEWSRRRRLAFALATIPLGVPLRVSALLANGVSSHEVEVWAALPVVLASYVATAVGAAAGYALGRGGSGQAFERIEGIR